MTNIGIDYGKIGGSNRNQVTGIHYGVISQHSLNPDVINDVISDGADYGEPTCPKCGNEAIEIPIHTESSDPPGAWVSVIQDVPEHMADYETSGYDYACDACEYIFESGEAFSDTAQGWTHESDGYKLTDCLDSDVFVIESPYYTYAQYCSPCVPGAGDLDSPAGVDSGAPKVYCLGHDWFESGRAPYRVWRVSDDTEVTAEVGE